MALFEQTPTRSGSRFGKLSSNMFFTRNTAKPKRVRHIEGLNGALICNVNDDPSVMRSTSATSLGFDRKNLPSFETPRRIERLVPPMGFWNTYGVIQDTERWRQELASLATASGLGIEKDEKVYHRPATTLDQQHASRSGAHYSSRTGRFNEGATKSRGRTGSKHATPYSAMLFHVPENEREMWMLQVLCQLLGTSDLQDVQSWLVSSSQTEKEQARKMINSALQGLKESERTSNQVEQPIDFDSLSNFVEKQKSEEKQASQKYIKESLNRPLSMLQSINEEEQQNDNHLGGSLTNLINNSNESNQTTTPYKRSYKNPNRRSYSSFDTTPSNTKNDLFDANDQEHEEDDDDKQINTISTNEKHQRSRSVSLTKMRKQSKTAQTPLERASTSHQPKHHVQSLQLNDDVDDDDGDQVYNYGNIENIGHINEYDYVEEEQQQRKEISLPPIKIKEQNNDTKSRKIRELQNKLSRQEEESKKQLNVLQSKQSRLENAIKLLTKHTPSYGKHRQQTHDQNQKDFDAPIVNVMIDPDKESDHHDKKREINLSTKYRESSKINNSRDDNRTNKSYSGIWKPDASTRHRLQGN